MLYSCPLPLPQPLDELAPRFRRFVQRHRHGVFQSFDRVDEYNLITER